jgi:cytochrome c biogenesis protein
MRTALILLFLLAVAAVPGSLLPQRPLNPPKAAAYIASHGAWGRLLDHVGMFDVFGSVWFAALYLLLAVSLIGCLIPRIRVHARALRTAPLPAPKNLSRLPESDTFAAAGTPETVARQARAALGRRWRTKTRTEPDGIVTVSAEKGYLRETGNLIFHIALLVAVVAVAADRLYHYEGSIIIQQGQGFCDTPVDLDSLQTGRLAAGESLAPFCIDNLNKFTASYTSEGEATTFDADVTYSLGANGHPIRHTITVNHPLRIEGDRVYLTGHGFAPQFTVHMPDGTTRTTTTSFLPDDAELTSGGAVKLQGAGTGKDIGISGLFAPDGVLNAAGLLSSASPQPLNPTIAIFIYRGNLGLGNGVPQNVYSLDGHQIATGALRQIGQATMTPGQTKTLPGDVSVRFDGYTQWVNLQISHNPGQDYLLLAVLAMVAGLIGSLSIRRRRVWLRIVSIPNSPDTDADTGSGSGSGSGLDGDGGPDPCSTVYIGGLARSDSGNFTIEFTALADRVAAALSPPMLSPPTQPLNPPAASLSAFEGADR